MANRLNPYILYRDGQAREAITFYQSVLGGQASIMTFGSMGATGDPAVDDRVMHGQLETPSGFTLMVSDLPDEFDVPFGRQISVALTGDGREELTRYWEGLSEGATIGQPLEQQAWGDLYGDLTDKFGVRWMFDISPAQ